MNDIVNVWSSNGELPLDLALRSHNGSIASTLVQHNADVNIRDDDGDTLLHRAIKQEDAFSALFLLDNNCNATLSTRSENDSALHLVAGAPNIEDGVKIAEKLINKNVNINAQNRLGYTALHISIQADNCPIFNLLLSQSSIDLNLKTNDDHVPLYYALLKYESGDDSPHSSYASLLLQRDVQTNAIYPSFLNNNLLQKLIEDGAFNAAVYLCNHMTNINHVNSEGETALHTACLKNAYKVVDKLLQLGANPNMATNDLRQTPLHYAVKGNAIDCIEVFIKIDGANFNARDLNGETPISLALAEGFNNLVPILIKGNADVNVRNGKDFTLLHQAILKEDSKTALFLLDNGADINAK